MKPLVATAPDRAALAARIRDIRARVAFYASTPAYRAAFDIHGLGPLADELKLLSRTQRWEAMPERISDEVLHTYAVVGTWDEIGEKLQARFGALVTNCEFSIPAGDAGSRERLRGLVAQLQAAPEPGRMRAILA